MKTNKSEYPLIITDANGNILFSQKSITKNTAVKAYIKTVTSEKSRGLVTVGNLRFFVKKILLTGKEYYFFMDFDTMFTCFGEKSAFAGENLFEVESIKKESQKECSLAGLLNIFISLHSASLLESGIRIEARNLDSNTLINVRPAAFTLCLSLMCRLCAQSAHVVRLGYAKDHGEVKVFVDAVGGEPVNNKASEVLRVLLYEIANAAGHKVEERMINGKRAFILDTHPLDIALLGFKATDFNSYKNIFNYYAAIL